MNILKRILKIKNPEGKYDEIHYKISSDIVETTDEISTLYELHGDGKNTDSVFKKIKTGLNNINEAFTSGEVEDEKFPELLPDRTDADEVFITDEVADKIGVPTVSNKNVENALNVIGTYYVKTQPTTEIGMVTIKIDADTLGVNMILSILLQRAI